MGRRRTDRAAPRRNIKNSERQKTENLLLDLGMLVGGASAFAFARILAFAPVIAGLASTLAFTRVLSLAGMLSFLIICEGAHGSAGFVLDAARVSLHREGSA